MKNFSTIAFLYTELGLGHTAAARSLPKRVVRVSIGEQRPSKPEQKRRGETWSAGVDKSNIRESQQRVNVWFKEYSRPPRKPSNKGDRTANAHLQLGRGTDSATSISLRRWKREY
jgi:hypothetical protein